MAYSQRSQELRKDLLETRATIDRANNLVTKLGNMIDKAKGNLLFIYYISVPPFQGLLQPQDVL